MTHECSKAASAGSDLELSVEIADGSGGEKALHQQQHSKHKESSCKAINYVLQDVDAAERTHITASLINDCLFIFMLRVLFRLLKHLQLNHHEELPETRESWRIYSH